MKTGILLMNTGTADEPTVAAVRQYLYEFLMDPAIIGAPEFFRKRIVNHIISRRPQRTLKNYEEFWTPQGSPFMIACYKQAERLALDMKGRMVDECQVAIGMRYGNPSILNGLHELRVGECDQVVLVPMYPQQVNVCAGTCLAKARQQLDKLKAQYGWDPQVFEVPYFYDQPSYQAALAKRVRKHWAYQPGARLLVSFHSTMLSDIEAGDPYKRQTEATAQALAQELGVPAQDVTVCYQSRFDSRKWLQPFTEDVAKQLAAQGVSDICVVCPGFTAENMETAIEVDRDLRATYLEAAQPGSQFTYVPALNADGGLIRAVADAIMQVLDGTWQPERVECMETQSKVPGHAPGKRKRK